MAQITESQFRQSFVSTVSRGRSFPKKDVDRQVLLISATLALDSTRTYSESEINDALAQWTAFYGESIGLDHNTLRRYLIDDRYLVRDPAGTTYTVNTTDLPVEYAPSIAQLDLDQLLEDDRLEREERKRAYMQASKK